jgi:hypothetical protein
MSFDPSEYRVLMDYRDKMLVNLTSRTSPGVRNMSRAPAGHGGTVGKAGRRRVTGRAPRKMIHVSIAVGAEALRICDRLGTIENGKLADVVVVAGNARRRTR